MKYLSILILFLIHFTIQIHHINQLSKLSLQDLDKDDLIEVDETSSNRAAQGNLTPNYYVVKVMHKEKKRAFLNMQNMFKKVVKILIKNRIIPQEDSLVKSRIKPQYLSKKRIWSFSTIFVIFGDEEELERAYKQLFRIRVQRLNIRPSINFLNEKVVALEVFNSAKKRLTSELARFPQLEIKDVIQIEIKGAQVQNSDLIEIQLEQEFNESQMTLSEEQILQGGQIGRSALEMKIIFRVGKYNEFDEDNQDYDDYEGNHSQEEDQTDQSEYSL